MKVNKSSSDFALARVVRLVDVRDRAVREMQERLVKEEFSEDAIAEALERAVNCGILDDERFANSYIRGKLRAGWGSQRIERELRRFGIVLDDLQNQDIIYEHFNQDNQIDRAVQALAKHHSSSKNQHQAKYRFLISRGYSSSVAQTALNIFEE
jgi:regulatory protein